jgi:hypothetical protein
MAALTTVLHSRGHEASKWPQLYQQDPDFATTYQLLGTCTNVMPPGPSLYSCNKACKDDLGSPLQLDGRICLRGENCGLST